MDSPSKTTAEVSTELVRVIGIASTVIASKPPSSNSSVSHTWFGTSWRVLLTMRGLICSVVPAETSWSEATSVPTTRAW